MQQSIMVNDGLRGGGSASFLLAQLGSHAAARFAEQIKLIGFVPAQAGILRFLAHTPGISQQDLASALNMHASRLVGVIDEMESSGFVERRPSARDRRYHELHLTKKGQAGLEDIGRVAREHNKELLSALSPEQQKQLAELLQAVASHQGLANGVHPGYRQMREQRSSHRLSGPGRE